MRPNPYSSEKRRKELDKKKKKEEKLQKKAMKKDQIDGETDESLDEDTDSVVPFQANSSLEKLIPKIAQLRKDLFEAWGKKLSKRLLMEL